jgi:hypothetical protein
MAGLRWPAEATARIQEERRGRHEGGGCREADGAASRDFEDGEDGEDGEVSMQDATGKKREEGTTGRGCEQNVEA